LRPGDPGPQGAQAERREDLGKSVGPDIDARHIMICSPETGSFWVRVFRVHPEGWEERKTMKALKFSDAQKAFILKQGADGIPVADICRRARISPATYFKWKKKYDGLLPTEMKRLKQLEDENTKLRKLVADLSLDREMLQDVIRRKL
jgi:putative transposase